MMRVQNGCRNCCTMFNFHSFSLGYGMIYKSLDCIILIMYNQKILKR